MSPSPQRATAFAKKPAVTKASRSKDGARGLAEAGRTQRVIPVKLAPLLAPYKRHGRLSIRIERLPQQARLSAGRNNGDNSWSLMLDQLEDLTYLPPEGMDEEHILSVRIIGLDGGGSTLAVLDFPVSPGGPGPDAADEESAAQDQTADASEHTQLRPLRAELAQMKASLIARESDLANARAAWEAEQDETSPSTGVLMRKGEAGPSKLTLAGDEIEMRCLRDELAAMQASLASRETALAEARLAADQARERWRQESDAAVSKAEIGWRADEAARLSAAQELWQERSASALAEARRHTEATLSKAEAAWKADEAARLARAEAQWQEKSAKSLAEVRAQVETALSKAGTAWKADEAARLAAAEAQWHEKSAKALEHTRGQSEAALSKAELAWKAGEAARLAALEAQWQEKSARTLAEATNRFEAAETALKQSRGNADAARDSNHEIALRRLREDLAATQANLSHREAALAEARSDLEQARERQQQGLEAALSEAEKAWKVNEAARLAAAEARWQETSARALVEARSRAEAARDSAHELELQRLRQEWAAAQTSPSNRETALAEARQVVEQARKAWRQESEEALSKAEKVWKADEATRFAAAEARWQEKSAAAFAEARAQAEKARDSAHEIELRRLREELAVMRAGSSNRETTMAETRLALEEARKAWRQESEAALSKAEEVWKAGEAARVAVAEAQWHEESAKTLAEATKRFEAAEGALKDVLIRTEATRESGNAIEHRRLREELAMMQASLADREAALAETRLALEHTREPPPTENKIVLKPDRMWSALERKDDRPPKRHLFRDLVVVASLAVAAIVFYPRIESFIPELPEIPGMGTILGGAPAPAGLRPQAAPPAVEQHMAVLNHGGNVRAGASPTAEVVTALQRGQKVATFEQNGKWTHIRIGGESGKTEPREGWIFSSFLDDPAGGKDVPPSAERK
ncbi:MAG TPA: SH3 domain-containing protein [Micropepsaceae bacterium]|nr:SH3 domain-containing protein [Micropepsaceae bacterium]